MSNELTTPAFKAMQTDIQVSMDDVVSAFVSQYENNLYARKKDLTNDIRVVEGELSDLDKAVLKKVTGKEYANTKLPFDMTLKVGDGSIDWGSKTPQVKFVIEIKAKKSDRYYSNTITIPKYKKIPAGDTKTHTRLREELSELRSDLSEVLVALKSVTRKERQVRGRIAMRKLEDSGYANLMKDEELIQLVQLED